MDILIIILLLIIAAEVTYVATESYRRSRRIHQAPVFVDTSVLIDGRIVAVAESGFLSRPLYIPRSVVGELQLLADNGDTEKRTRARHGLDIINQLQSIEAVDVVIFADSVRAEEGVDNRLLELATTHKGALCTIDYNLNKVAVVQGIQVLNINELAKTLRMAYLPGEKIKIEITQKGNDPHQGVGHLPDGTMVVVENAHRQVGTVAEVEFIRSLQTAAGKMMFAKLVGVVQGSKASVRKTKQSVVEKETASKPAEQKKARSVRGTKPATQSAAQDSRAKKAEQVKKLASGSTTVRTAAKQPATSAASTRAPQRRRRKSPEDSLVELANS